MVTKGKPVKISVILNSNILPCQLDNYSSAILLLSDDRDVVHTFGYYGK